MTICVIIRLLFDKFYKITLIVFRILNLSMHLEFRIFDVMFDHI